MNNWKNPVQKESLLTDYFPAAQAIEAATSPHGA